MTLPTVATVAALANDVLIDRQNSQPISLGDDRAVVLRVTSHSEPRQQTLAEVRTAVTPRLPRTEPTPPCTKSTSRCATLPRPINSPA